jgi:ectoine hydroxylase-related dioxygenase (phytanoyl-CoA dioxygenase family)
MEAVGPVAERYARDGFVLVENVLSRDECSALKAEGVEVLRQHARPGASVYVGAAAVSPVFRALASDDRLVRTLRDLLPGGVMFMSDKLVFKSGLQRKPTPWHCDEAYWRGTRPKLSAWIALDDVSASNGALRVLPGGHLEKWTHTAPGGKGEEFDLRIRDLDGRQGETVVCEMAAGSALFFSDRLPHSSTPNTDGSDRYAIISTYHDPAPDEEFDLGFPARHVIEPASSQPTVDGI